MIFTAIGLLVLGLALLIAGMAKSSVLLLMLSLVSTVAAIAVLAVSYSIARRTGLASGALPAMPTPAAGAPPLPGQPGQGVFMYVPVDQIPTMAPAAAVHAGGNGNGTGTALAAAPVAGYDEMTAEQVGKLIASGALNEGQLQALRDYEAAHAARKTVLERIDRSLFNA